MNRSSHFVFALRGWTAVFLCLTLVSSAAAQPYDFWRPMLHTEALTDTIPGVVHHFSSWDRTGGNSDLGYYYGTDANGWKILCDVSGPGVLTEFWWTWIGASDARHIRIYVGDTLAPDLDAVLNQFCGDTPPFVPPLADSSGGANFSYVPIPFQSHLRITYSGQNYIYFHASVLGLPAGMVVEDMTFPPSPTFLAKRDSLAARFNNPETPAFIGYAMNLESASVNVGAGQTATLLEHDGAGVYRRLFFNTGSHTQEVFENLRVQVFVDHFAFPDLEGPVSLLFGAALGWRPYRSAVTGMLGDSLYFNLPIPFRSHCRIEITNGTAATQFVHVAAEKVDVPAASQGMLMLRAVSADANPVIRWSGFEIVDLKGRGTFLGTLLDMQSIMNSVLEGDETIFFDGETVPSWRGTGTEDYFNGGYYWTNSQGIFPAQLAFHGCIRFSNWGGEAAAYRWHLSDPVPFHNGLRMTMEVGPFNELSGYYRSIALAYVVPAHWQVRDVSGDGASYPSEPLRIAGRGLPPGAAVTNVQLGGEELNYLSGSNAVTVDSVLDVTYGAPAGIATGDYSFQLWLDGQMNVADTLWSHASHPQLHFHPQRADQDTLVFAGDTLEVAMHGMTPGQTATVNAGGTVLPWLGTPPLADAAGRIQARVTIPLGLEFGDLSLTASSSGVPDALCTLLVKHRPFWRLEVEALTVSSYQGNRRIDWAPGYLPPNSTEPWGRNLAQHFTGSGVGSYLALSFNMPVSGEYQISYFLGRTAGGAVVRTLLDDSLDLANYDTYYSPIGWRWTRTDTLRGTARYVSAGPHVLRFEIVGRNQTTDWKMIIDQMVMYPAFMTPPRAISDLVIQTDSSGVRLTWTRIQEDVSGNPLVVNGYTIYRADAGDSAGVYDWWGEVPGTDSSFTDTTMHADTSARVFYQVIAWLGSSPSRESPITLPARATKKPEIRGGQPPEQPAEKEKLHKGSRSKMYFRNAGGE